MKQADLEHCAEAIRHGSHSFHAASKVLPKHVRNPAFALYAFCRLADDAVDLNAEKIEAVLSLRDRLDLIYKGTPRDTPVDRAFAGVIEEFDMPRALPEALLEGLAWDALDKRYDSFSDVVSYSARVASAVGVMMCVLMRVRDPNALARAADLGVAMQLTNIARDVGEDAAEQRLYLPQDWLREAGIAPQDFLAAPDATPEIRAIVARLLREAGKLYDRSEAGIGKLPMSCRTGILAARHIYAAIGADLAAHRFDSLTRRAHTTKARKLGLLAKSVAHATSISFFPQSAVIYAKPLPEVAFLINATAQTPEPGWGERRSGALFSVLAQLEERDQRQKGHYPRSTPDAI